MDLVAALENFSIGELVEILNADGKPLCDCSDCMKKYKTKINSVKFKLLKNFASKGNLNELYTKLVKDPMFEKLYKKNKKELHKMTINLGYKINKKFTRLEFVKFLYVTRCKHVSKDIIYASIIELAAENCDNAKFYLNVLLNSYNRNTFSNTFMKNVVESMLSSSNISLVIYTLSNIFDTKYSKFIKSSLGCNEITKCLIYIVEEQIV